MWCLYCGLVAGFFLPGFVQTQDTPTPDELVGLIEKLSPENDSDTRIAAAKKIDLENPASMAACPALEVGLKDESADIRSCFGVTLALILHNNDRPCTVDLAKLLLDPDEGVRANLEMLSALFEEFDKKCLPLIMTYYERQDARGRREALPMLGLAGGDDRQVLEILHGALESDHAQARVNATVAIWNATRDLDSYVPLVIKRLNELAEPSDRDKALPEDKEELPGVTYLALGSVGFGRMFCVHLAERPNELLSLLNDLLQDDSVDNRHGLLRWIANGMAVANHVAEVDKPRSIPEFDPTPLKPLIARMLNDTDPDVAEQAQVAQRQLQKLLDNK